MADYIYNGVQLPQVPDVDGFAFQSIYVFGNTYWFFASELQQYISTTDSGDAIHALVPNVVYWYTPGQNTAWELVGYDVYNGGQLLKFYDFVWCNKPIEKDGIVVHEGTDPVPVNPVKINPALLVQSFFTGQAIRRMRGKPVETPEEPEEPEKTLIGYSYNGVGPLPDIEALPSEFSYRVLVFYSQASVYYAYCFASERIYKNNYLDIVGSYGSMATSYGYEDGTWIFKSEGSMNGLEMGSWAQPVWSNYDILNADGSVYLAASEPVPVYE